MEGSVRKKGNTWYYRIDLYQNGVRKQIERKGGATKKEAFKKLNEELYTINQGYEIASEQLVYSYLNLWLEEFIKPNRAINTYYKYKVAVEKYIDPCIGNIKLNELKVIHLERLLNKLKATTLGNGKKLSNTTIRAHFLTLNAALNKAVKLQLITHNPCISVEIPKKNKYKANILTQDEVALIYNSLNTSDYNDELFKLAIAMELELGLRRGELCGLSWDNIDFYNKVVHIRKALIRIDKKYELSGLKTEGSERDLPVSVPLLSILKVHKVRQNENKLKFGELYKASNMIFTNQIGECVIPSRFLQRLKRICKRLGIEKNVRWHDLRHTNATLLLSNKVSMKVIQERLGHSLMQTTSDIYAHVTDELNREATDILTTTIYSCGKDVGK